MNSFLNCYLVFNETTKFNFMDRLFNNITALIKHFHGKQIKCFFVRQVIISLCARALSTHLMEVGREGSKGVERRMDFWPFRAIHHNQRPANICVQKIEIFFQ